MKMLLALAIAFFTVAAPVRATACDYNRPVSYSSPYLVCTKEVCRHSACRWAINSCGHRYSYEVIVITYADYYSDGSVQRYTRTFRA